MNFTRHTRLDVVATPARKRGLTWTGWIAICFVSMMGWAQATTLISDDFSTLNTAVWNTSSVNAPTVSGGSLVAAVGTTNVLSHSALVTKATNFNPFTNPITMTLSGLTLGGNPGSGRVGFYAMIGNMNTTNPDSFYVSGGNPTSNNPYNSGTGLGGYLGIEVFKTSSSNILKIYDYGNTNAVAAPTLSAIPTSIALTIDGTANLLTISITGATFNSMPGSPSTYSYALQYFNASVLGSSSSLAIGAVNSSYGTSEPTTPASFGIDSILVTSVPEPRTALLFIIAVVPLLYRRRSLLRRTAV